MSVKFLDALPSSESSNHSGQSFLAAEVLGFVVWRLLPNVVLVGGGTNSLGFYYDFIFEQPLTESMMELIEVHLNAFIKEAHPLHFMSMMRENAQALFEHHKHFLLAERAGRQELNVLELVQIESFYGLCPTLSFKETDEIGHVKLLESQELAQDIEGEEVCVTRVLGVCRKSFKDLKVFLKSYASFLKKKDHRELGPKLSLFSFPEPMDFLGMIWHPKGVQLQQLLLNWLKRELPQEEAFVSTPVVGRQDFLGMDPRSLETFMFEGQEYRLRSSPLRQHLEFFRQNFLENEELPYRITEYPLVFRKYPEAEWWGLFCRCVYFGDYTTICCLREQVVSELISSLHFIEQIITIFDFEAQWYLIASQHKGLRARQEQEAVKWLKEAIQVEPRLYPYCCDLRKEEIEEGNPFLELRVRDVLGREWPISRVSVILPMQGRDSLGVEKAATQKVILTRQIWESLDRLIALLIERYEGNFPFWLIPEQIRVIVIGEANRDYAQKVSRYLQGKGLRVKLDIRDAKLNLKIHQAEKENIPYLVLIGEQERIKQRVSIRERGKFNQTRSVEIEQFLNTIYEESLCPVLPKERAE